MAFVILRKVNSLCVDVCVQVQVCAGCVHKRVGVARWWPWVTFLRAVPLVLVIGLELSDACQLDLSPLQL